MGVLALTYVGLATLAMAGILGAMPVGNVSTCARAFTASLVPPVVREGQLVLAAAYWGISILWAVRLWFSTPTTGRSPSAVKESQEYASIAWQAIAVFAALGAYSLAFLAVLARARPLYSCGFALAFLARLNMAGRLDCFRSELIVHACASWRSRVLTGPFLTAFACIGHGEAYVMGAVAVAAILRPDFSSPAVLALLVAIVPLSLFAVAEGAGEAFELSHAEQVAFYSSQSVYATFMPPGDPRVHSHFRYRRHTGKVKIFRACEAMLVWATGGFLSLALVGHPMHLVILLIAIFVLLPCAAVVAQCAWSKVLRRFVTEGHRALATVVMDMLDLPADARIRLELEQSGMTARICLESCALGFALGPWHCAQFVMGRIANQVLNLTLWAKPLTVPCSEAELQEFGAVIGCKITTATLVWCLLSATLIRPIRLPDLANDSAALDATVLLQLPPKSYEVFITIMMFAVAIIAIAKLTTAGLRCMLQSSPGTTLDQLAYNVYEEVTHWRRCCAPAALLAAVGLLGQVLLVVIFVQAAGQQDWDCRAIQGAARIMLACGGLLAIVVIAPLTYWFHETRYDWLMQDLGRLAPIVQARLKLQDLLEAAGYDKGAVPESMRDLGRRAQFLLDQWPPTKPKPSQADWNFLREMAAYDARTVGKGSGDWKEFERLRLQCGVIWEDLLTEEVRAMDTGLQHTFLVGVPETAGEMQVLCKRLAPFCRTDHHRATLAHLSERAAARAREEENEATQGDDTRFVLYGAAIGAPEPEQRACLDFGEEIMTV